MSIQSLKTVTFITTTIALLSLSNTANADPGNRASVASSSGNYYSSTTGHFQYKSDRRINFHFQKAVRLYSAGDWDLAEIVFEQVLNSSPQFTNKYYYKANAFLGLINANQNDHKSAVGYFRQAVFGNPNLYGLKSALGLSYIRLGEKSKAEAVLANLKEKKDRSVYQGAQEIDLRSSIAVLENALNLG